MNYSKLKSMLKQKRITQEMIASQLDLTPQAVQAALYREKLKIEYLEGICEMLNMHPGEFFEGEFIPPSANQSELIQALREQISLQKEVIKYKDHQLAECLKKIG